MNHILQCPQCSNNDIEIVGIDRFIAGMRDGGAYAHGSAVVIRFACASCGPYEQYRLRLMQYAGHVTLEWDVS